VKLSPHLVAVALLGAFAVLGASLLPEGGGETALAGRRRRKKFLKVRKFKPRHNRKFVDPEGELRVRFSKPLDEETISRATVLLRELTGYEVPWTYRLERKGKELIVVPEIRLQSAKDYLIEVRPGLASASGLTLKKAKSASFFTDPIFPPTQILRPDQFSDVEGRMSVGRTGHSATRLGDGRVLLAGGVADQNAITNTADQFFPGSDRFVPALARMKNPRAFHPAVQMGNGAMLIGGWDGNQALAATEFFEPNSSSFIAGPEMNEERDFHAAVRLADGRVLVTGGLSYTGAGAFFSDTAEIYDPAVGEWRFALGRPTSRRGGHSLTLLPDGRVLIIGGVPSGGSGGSSALFDPADESFRATAGSPLQARSLHSATLLDDKGRVLVSDGGSPVLEFYEPVEERFFSAGGASFINRTESTASLLPDGRVILAGGLDTTNGTLILSGMDVYVPSQGDFGRVVRAGVVFAEPRAGHTATTLSDDRILFAGGRDPDGEGGLVTGVIFTPDPVTDE